MHQALNLTSILTACFEISNFSFLALPQIHLQDIYVSFSPGEVRGWT